ncbi:AbrB/MazE/SpoVT family DNA-binding domain-containing protein [Loigolactobacillus bifermentans]|uniref:SpoVT-AbrB domain-containing protein n=1 Tax=Loigolactobacillus bifermentans DSM 20003 TaxID=1423726 RepID=A0A0R1GST0_9LACO|nr:AbrB/MazE/SpoVT family DNA-binding domain-containing protein [Loigolactobacillus bifermentans]KRK34506.1 hypothetical protein FC07_GL000515 [Loigolactobacillus bifermentans DSM 20003]QGG61281.1 AbrB/MazE/SpoVT family DNA-binding domain-containing protein [Loigolactobacillus bifermentans]
MNARAKKAESTMSAKGQIVMPIEIRKHYGIQPGDKVVWHIDDHNNLTVLKEPTADEWSAVLKNIPVEVVEMDENGNYDPKQSPDFHDWLLNG